MQGAQHDRAETIVARRGDLGIWFMERALASRPARRTPAAAATRRPPAAPKAVVGDDHASAR